MRPEREARISPSTTPRDCGGSATLPVAGLPRKMVETLGFQPRTPRLQGGCSRRLSYAPVALSSDDATPRRAGHRGAPPRPPVQAPFPRWPGWGCRGRAASEPAERRSGASRKRRAQKRSIIEAPLVTVRRAGRRFPVAARAASVGSEMVVGASRVHGGDRCKQTRQSSDENHRRKRNVTGKAHSRGRKLRVSSQLASPTERHHDHL